MNFIPGGKFMARLDYWRISQFVEGESRFLGCSKAWGPKLQHHPAWVSLEHQPNRGNCGNNPKNGELYHVIPKNCGFNVLTWGYHGYITSGHVWLPEGNNNLVVMLKMYFQVKMGHSPILFHRPSNAGFWGHTAHVSDELVIRKAILGWFLLLTMIPVRSQWGRYNLPRSMYTHNKGPFCTAKMNKWTLPFIHLDVQCFRPQSKKKSDGWNMWIIIKSICIYKYTSIYYQNIYIYISMIKCTYIHQSEEKQHQSTVKSLDLSTSSP